MDDFPTYMLAPPTPSWRGKSHAAAAPLLWVSAGSLVSSSVAKSVFAAGHALVFSASAAYHNTHSPRLKRWLRRTDHSMIFVGIASTFTPVICTVLPEQYRRSALTGVWSASLASAVTKFVTFRDDDAKTWSSTVFSASYVVFGWTGVSFVPFLLRTRSYKSLAGLLAGGVIYTAGALGLSKRWPDPLPDTFGYHEVWHAATIAAFLAHAYAVYNLPKPSQPVPLSRRERLSRVVAKARR